MELFGSIYRTFFCTAPSLVAAILRLKRHPFDTLLAWPNIDLARLLELASVWRFLNILDRWRGKALARLACPKLFVA